MTINNTNDLKVAYMILRSNLLKNPADIKREIRRFLKSDSKVNGRIIKKYSIDGYIVLINLPEWIHDDNEAKEYFIENEYMDPYYTGRPFTRWYKVFKRRDRWMAYHAVCFDM